MVFKDDGLLEFMLEELLTVLDFEDAASSPLSFRFRRVFPSFSAFSRTLSVMRRNSAQMRIMRWKPA